MILSCLKYLVTLASYISAAIGAILLAARALAIRHRSLGRQRSRQPPAVVFGPVPILSIKWIKAAVAEMASEAKTIVYEVYGINRTEDFDVVAGRTFWGINLNEKFARAIGILFGDYVLFWRLLGRFDIYHSFFDGGFLARTPLRFLEVHLLHLAAKKLIVLPYGGDVAVTTDMSSLVWRQAIMTHYPRVARRQAEIRQFIEVYSRHADFIVGDVFHTEGMQRWDLLPIHYFPIDTSDWQVTNNYTNYNGIDGPVSIAHAANHRFGKGTRQLVRACEELRAEGLQVELRLLDRVPQAELRRVFSDSDIIADQFNVGYALTAMEAMALGKPVIGNNLEGYHSEAKRIPLGLDECPIVATNPEVIKENIRRLVRDPNLRRSVGIASRAYVEKHHSLAAMSRMWHIIYRKIWYGEAIDCSIWHPDTVYDVERSAH